MKNFILSAFLLLLFSVICLSQSNFQKVLIEDGWKGIKPFQTTRLQVEKIFENPTDNAGDKSYHTDDVLIHITYSVAPCTEDQYGRGEYNIAQDIVLGYQVILKKEIKLSDLDWKKDFYEREEDQHKRGLVSYVNQKDGVSLRVNKKDRTERVYSISYFPTKELAAKFLCESK